MAAHKHLNRLKDQFITLYIEGKSSVEISKLFNTTPTGVVRILRKYGVKIRSAYECQYKGKKFPQKDGYVTMTIPLEDRYLFEKGKTETKEHRYVMSKFLNRKLERHEAIHHINGIRNDNRIENLQLWSTKQPNGQSIEDKLKYAREIIALYGDIEDLSICKNNIKRTI